jgi:Rad3-related DNA helicase
MKDLFVVSSHSEKSIAYRDFLKCPNGTLLTASTVFWEGITVDGVRLLVIFEPPFPRPRLVDLLKKRISNGQADMSRRLKQGLGRVGRKKGESGIAITLFDVKRVGRGSFLRVLSDVRLLRVRSYRSTVIIHKIFTDRSVSVESFYSLSDD